MQVAITPANSIDGKQAFYRDAPASPPQTLTITIALAGVDDVTLGAASKIVVSFPADATPASVATTASGPWSAVAQDGADWLVSGPAAAADWRKSQPVVLIVTGLVPEKIASPTLAVKVLATLRTAFDQTTTPLTVPVDDYKNKDLADLQVSFAIVGRPGVELGSGSAAKLTLSI